MATHFFWDPVEDNIIQERDDTGAITVDYTTEPYLYGDLVSQRRSGQSRLHCYDGLGSTRALTDSSGNVTDTWSYTGWGEVTERTGSAENPFEYVGQKGYYKPVLTGAIGVRERVLSSMCGRWFSVDRIRLDESISRIAASSLHGYGYAKNAPSTHWDPSGLLEINIIQRVDRSAACPKSGDPRRLILGMKLQFLLNRRKGCEGYFVQAVTYFCRLNKDCGKCPCGDELFAVKTFFQAWHVAEGSIFAEEEIRLPTPRDHTDFPRSEVFADSCGEKLSVGVVKFYCKDKRHADAGGVGTEDLDALWPKNKTWGAAPCQVEVGDIPSTDQRPTWWDNDPVEGPGRNYLVVAWNCCPPEDAKWVFASGGVISFNPFPYWVL